MPNRSTLFLRIATDQGAVCLTVPDVIAYDGDFPHNVNLTRTRTLPNEFGKPTDLVYQERYTNVLTFRVLPMPATGTVGRLLLDAPKPPPDAMTIPHRNMATGCQCPKCAGYMQR